MTMTRSRAAAAGPRPHESGDSDAYQRLEAVILGFRPRKIIRAALLMFRPALAGPIAAILVFFLLAVLAVCT